MYSLLQKTEGAHSDGIWAVDWCSGEGEEAGQRLISGSLDNAVVLWRWEEANARLVAEKRLQAAHQLGVISVKLAPDGATAASSSTESAIKLWNSTTGDCFASIDAGPADAWTLVWSPDGAHIATGTQAGKIQLYSASDGQKAATLETGGKFVLSVAFSPDGRLVAAASQEGIVYVFDLQSAALLHTLEAHAMPCRALVFTPDSNLLVTASDDKYVKIHDVASAASLVATMPGHESWVLALDASPAPASHRIRLLRSLRQALGPRPARRSPLLRGTHRPGLGTLLQPRRIQTRLLLRGQVHQRLRHTPLTFFRISLPRATIHCNSFLHLYGVRW